jgi:hypothetical protein
VSDLVAAWATAVPAALVAALWCVLPGLLVTLAAGLRGVLAGGLAPAVSISTIGVAAVVASVAGVPWSPAVAVVPAAVLAVLVAAVRRLPVLRRRRVPSAPDGWSVALAVLAGSAVAAAVGTVTVLDAMGPPTTLSQTYDAVFHYNAVAHILADGDASSLTLGTLTSPGAGAAFYPAAWHDVVSLVVLSTGVSVPVASNVVAAVVAAVVWPLGCLALVRVVVGASWAALAATPVVAVGFVAFPWSLLGFGVLWPNLIGLSLVPAALAAVVVAAGLGRSGALTRVRALLLLPVAVVGLGLGHPNAVFSLAVLALFPAAWWFARTLGAIWRSRTRVGAVLLGLVGVVAVAAAAGVLLTSPLFDDVRSFDWPAFQSPLGAAGEVALGATNRRDPAWVLAVVVLLGALATLPVARYRWLVPAHLAAAALYVLAAGSESPLAAAVTAFWYNDSFRLAAMLPVTGVVLAVVGLVATGSLLHRALPSARVPAGAVTAFATAAVLVATGGMYATSNAAVVDDNYAAGPGALVDPAERAFYAEVSALVPADAVVAQNPWSGSALLWPLTGREVLFPHLSGNWTPDQTLLAGHLRDAATDARVCAAATRLDVRYLLVGVPDFWLGDQRALGYPGLAAPEADRGFRLLAADATGDALYELTACGAPPSG